MFCDKCGQQLPDGAAFCGNCGNRIGEPAPAQPQAADTAPVQTPAAAAKPKETPVIFKNLLDQAKAFFTGKDPVKVVADSASDKSWSGAIILGVLVIIYALAAMVNFNQSAGSTGGAGAAFGLSLVTALMTAGAAVGMLFVVLKNMYKKDASFQGCLNIVAYAAMPLIAVFLLNMLFGLIWGQLPGMITSIAMAATLLLIYTAANSLYGQEKSLLLGFVVAVAVVILVSTLFTYLMTSTASKSVFSSALDDWGSYLDGLGGLFG